MDRPPKTNRTGNNDKKNRFCFETTRPAKISNLFPPIENLQHQIFSVQIHVTVSPLEVVNGLGTIENKIPCSHDHPNTTASDTNPFLINWYLRWHFKTLKSKTISPKSCLEGCMAGIPTREQF